jgi:hypothetical protein
VDDIERWKRDDYKPTKVRKKYSGSNENNE